MVVSTAVDSILPLLEVVVSSGLGMLDVGTLTFYKYRSEHLQAHLKKRHLVAMTTDDSPGVSFLGTTEERVSSFIWTQRDVNLP